MKKLIYTNEYGGYIEFSSDSKCRLIRVDGVSVNNINTSEVSSENQIGTTITNTYVQPRLIEFEGDFKESYVTRKKLLNIVIPSVKAEVRIIDTELNLEYYIEGTPTITPAISNDKVYQKFQFTIRCPYPYWRSSKSQIKDFFKVTSHFKFPRSFSNTIPWKIATHETLSIVNVVNESSVKTGFTLRLKALASVQCPSLLNVKTQEAIKLRDDYTMQTGDVFILENYSDRLKAYTIRSGVQNNAFQLVDLDETTFFELAVGDNILKYDAKTNANKLEVSISFDTLQVGI